MRTAFSGRLSTVGSACLMGITLWLIGCSIPNLEPSECTEARDVVREFYSFHFGNDMHPTPENVRLREKWLSQKWATKLKADASGMPPTKIDYFTNTEDFPKAFRVGGCKVNSPSQSVTFDLLLFWKDDTRTEQKRISVTVNKENGKWLIDAVD